MARRNRRMIPWRSLTKGATTPAAKSTAKNVVYPTVRAVSGALFFKSRSALARSRTAALIPKFRLHDTRRSRVGPIVRKAASFFGNKRIAESSHLCGPVKLMEFARAKIAVALVTACSLMVGGRAGGQNPAQSLSTKPAEAAGQQNPAAASESSVAEGKTLYQHECLSCHGPAGKGEGPKAATLDVNPADLSRPKISQQSDEALSSRTVEQSPIPPPFPDERAEFGFSEVFNSNP